MHVGNLLWILLPSVVLVLVGTLVPPTSRFLSARLCRWIAATAMAGVLLETLGSGLGLLFTWLALTAMLISKALWLLMAHRPGWQPEESLWINLVARRMAKKMLKYERRKRGDPTLTMEQLDAEGEACRKVVVEAAEAAEEALKKMRDSPAFRNL